MQLEVDRTGGWTVGAINVLKRDIAKPMSFNDKILEMELKK